MQGRRPGKDDTTTLAFDIRLGGGRYGVYAPIGGVMVTTTIDTDVEITIRPRNRVGADSPIDGEPTWTSSAPSIVSVEPVAGTNGRIVMARTRAMGTARVEATVDGDMGAAVRNVVGGFDIQVEGGETQTVEFETRLIPK